MELGQVKYRVIRTEEERPMDMGERREGGGANKDRQKVGRTDWRVVWWEMHGIRESINDRDDDWYLSREREREREGEGGGGYSEQS